MTVNLAKPQGLSFLLHGLPKAGKSSLGDSGPLPRLLLDAEGAAYWTPSRKVEWNPVQGPPPAWDGTWDTCVVYVSHIDTVAAAYKVLVSGQHPFKSLTIDSITEVQQRLIDKIAGLKKMEFDHWGIVLRQISLMTRQFRDLIKHPTNPLWSVTFVAGTHLERKSGRWRPLVQGQSEDYLPYYVDIEGFLLANTDGTRDMFIGPHPIYETGERVAGRLPGVLRVGYPGRPGYTIEDMLRQVLAA